MITKLKIRIGIGHDEISEEAETDFGFLMTDQDLPLVTDTEDFIIYTKTSEE